MIRIHINNHTQYKGIQIQAYTIPRVGETISIMNKTPLIVEEVDHYFDISEGMTHHIVRIGCKEIEEAS